MHRIDDPTATPDNRFTEGDPSQGVPATVVTAEWLNAVQEELAALVEGAGLQLDKAATDQVLNAVLALIAANAVMPDYATTAAAGIVELATEAEAEAGTDASRAVTPKALAAALTAALVAATTSQAGIVELATDAEAQAGTDTTRAVTPKALAAAIADLALGALKNVDTSGAAAGDRLRFDGLAWGPQAPAGEQVFTTSGSMDKPDASLVLIEAWGGGGGGADDYGAGGGGGAYAWRLMRVDDIAWPVTVTVGAGGAGNSNGGNSTFGPYLTAYGGGKGGRSSGAGGGGGGAMSAGAGTTPGRPDGALSQQDAVFGGGGGSKDVQRSGTGGGWSLFGGGGGGAEGMPGGQSLYGGAGGAAQANGEPPGGGGGGARGSGWTPGSGARGEVRVRYW